MVFLYCLKTHGSSLNQSAFPAKKTGFFNKLRIVLITRSAIEGPLSVNLEKLGIFLFLKKFWKILL